MESRRKDRKRRQRLLSLLATALLVFPLALAGPARASQISEVALAEGDDYPWAIAADHEGNVWFGLSRRIAYEFPYPPTYRAEIDRLAVDGQITRFLLGDRDPFPAAMAAGPDGAMWFTQPAGSEIGRIAQNGETAEFPVAAAPGAIVAGPDGNLWFTETKEGSKRSWIGRISPTGEVTEFPLPKRRSGSVATGITVGPDGNLWFAESLGRHSGKVGYITPSGRLHEFSVRSRYGAPSSIALGPDGNLWFTQGSAIGRITSRGIVTEFKLPPGSHAPNEITAGTEGKLWFTKQRAGVLGEITTGGEITQIRLPEPGSYPFALAPGPDGSVWFAAGGEGPCRGGGGACSIIVPHHPSRIGHVTPGPSAVSGPLAVEFPSSRASLSNRHARILMACRGGAADAVCSGVLSISSRAGAHVLAEANYKVLANETRPITPQLSDQAVRLLAHRSRLRVSAIATVAEGNGASRVLWLGR